MAGKKLPRRVKSMANRATKIAEDAADLDLLTGDDDGGEGEGRKVAPSPFAYAGAWIGGIVVLVALILVVRAVFAIPLPSTGSADFAPSGALTRVTPVYAGLATPFGNGGVASAPRSAFPAARQEAPIILSVACPDGTIQIAVGDRVADTVCIPGVLVGNAPSIGGTSVPFALACEEDEVIFWRGIDTLACLHIDHIAHGTERAPPSTPTPTPTG